jgi:hypothetical protein
MTHGRRKKEISSLLRLGHSAGLSKNTKAAVDRRIAAVRSGRISRSPRW